MWLHGQSFALWALVLSLLFSVCAAVPADPNKVKKPKKPPAPPIGTQLTLQDFHATIHDEYWFVEFYSPICPHCKKFAPTWKQFVESDINQTPKLHFAQVNCQVQGDLCADQGVKGYPELNFFYNGKRIAQFEEDRYAPKLRDFVKTQMTKNEAAIAAPPPAAEPPKVAAPKPVEEAKQQPDPPFIPEPQVGVQEVEQVVTIQVPNPDGKVVTLDLSTFRNAIEEGEIFIKFYAPWCGYCKKLAPVWEQLAEKMKGKLKIAEVNCDDHKAICQAQGVEGYPQMLYYSRGKKIEFSGKREYAPLEAFAHKLSQPAITTGIDLQHFEEALKTKDVFFFLHTPRASTLEHIVEDGARVLVGYPPVFASADPRILDKHSGLQSPSLTVFKDGKLDATFPLSSSAMPTSDQVSKWLLAHRLPPALELTPENFADVMKSPSQPLIVLTALDPSAKSYGSFTNKIQDAARQWRDRRSSASASYAARNREVVFVWMDGVNWSAWLKDMYGVKRDQMPKVVIADHSKLIYYDTDASGKTINFQTPNMIVALEDALRGATKVKHSENIAERSVRYINNKVEMCVTTVQNNWTTSLVGLGIFFGLVFVGLRRCMHVDRSVYVPQHGGRLD